MSYRLNKPDVHIECVPDEIFAISCYSASPYFDPVFCKTIDLLQLCKHDTDRISLIRAVVRVEDPAVFIDQNEFGGSAPRIHPKPCIP